MDPKHLDVLLASAPQAGAGAIAKALRRATGVMVVEHPRHLPRPGDIRAATDSWIIAAEGAERINTFWRRCHLPKMIIVACDARRLPRTQTVVDSLSFLAVLRMTEPGTPVIRFEQFTRSPGAVLQQITRRDFRGVVISKQRQHHEPDTNLAEDARLYQQVFGYEPPEPDLRQQCLARSFRGGWRGGRPETPCGPGSTLSATEVIGPELVALLRRFGVQTLSDAGCGDLNWLACWLPPTIEYRGYDIVAHPSWSSIHFGASASCRVCDFSLEQLEPSDLVLCRDALVHLPNHMVLSALQNFRSTAPLLLTTTFPDVDNRHRLLVPGGFAPLDLSAPPFLLGQPLHVIHEQHPGKCLALWRLRPETDRKTIA